MSFLTPLFLVGARRPRDPGDPAPDSEGAEERRAVPVADVPAADSVSVRAAPPDPALAAAAAAAGGAGADRRWRSRGRSSGGRRSRPRRRRARAKSSSCSIGPTAWATAIAGSARWPRRADAINGLTPADRASIVFFARAPRSRCDRRRIAAGCRRRSPTSQPGAGATRYGPALKLAGSILERVGAAAARSDPDHRFPAQSAGRAAEGVRLPDGAVLTPVPIGDARTGEPRGHAGRRCSARRSRIRSASRSRPASVNHSDAAASNVDVALEVGGRGDPDAARQLEPNGSASVTFDPVTVAEPQRARDRAARPTTRWRATTSFNFVVSPEEPVRVIIAERPGAPRDTQPLSARALARRRSAAVRDVQVRPADSLTTDDLNARSVVILNDAPVAPGDRRAARRVRRARRRAVRRRGRTRGLAAAGRRAPGVPGAAVDRSRGAAARARRARVRPSRCSRCSAAPRTGDFCVGALLRLSQRRPRSQASQVAGAVRRRRSRRCSSAAVGTGRVLMWTSTLDTTWTDLRAEAGLPALRPSRRPLPRRRTASRGRGARSATSSSPGLQAPARRRPTSRRVALTPSGERVSLDGDGPEVLELAEQGFYEFRAQGRDADQPVVVASNVDLAESDLTPIDPQEIVAAALGRAGGERRRGPTAPPTDEAQEAAQRVWWYLLFAGLLLLGAKLSWPTGRQCKLGASQLCRVPGSETSMAMI